MNELQVWDLFYDADSVRAMLSRKIQEESMRTYLFTYSNVYDSISIVSIIYFLLDRAFIIFFSWWRKIRIQADGCPKYILFCNFFSFRCKNFKSTFIVLYYSIFALNLLLPDSQF